MTKGQEELEKNEAMDSRKDPPVHKESDVEDEYEGKLKEEDAEDEEEEENKDKDKYEEEKDEMDQELLDVIRKRAAGSAAVAVGVPATETETLAPASLLPFLPPLTSLTSQQKRRHISSSSKSHPDQKL